MITLVKLARACRRANSSDDRVRFAEEIVIRVGPPISDFIARRVPKDSAEDVLQETLIAIANGAGDFRGRKDSDFWGWCYRIAGNKIADRFRRQSRHDNNVSLDIEEVLRAVEASDTKAPIGPEERTELSETLAALKRVKPPCVGLLLDRFIVGLEFPELAVIYGSTPNAVRMNVNRCLKSAQELLTGRK